MTVTTTTTTGTTTTVGARDDDDDGLTNSEEEKLGTDPNNEDSDGDGWNDGDEVNGNTDPLDKSDHPYTGGWAIGDCHDEVISTGNEVGQIADDFSLNDQFGDTIRLHSFCDRSVLLVAAAFW